MQFYIEIHSSQMTYKIKMRHKNKKGRTSNSNKLPMSKFKLFYFVLNIKSFK